MENTIPYTPLTPEQYAELERRAQLVIADNNKYFAEQREAFFKSNWRERERNINAMIEASLSPEERSAKELKRKIEAPLLQRIAELEAEIDELQGNNASLRHDAWDLERRV